MYRVFRESSNDFDETEGIKEFWAKKGIQQVQLKKMDFSPANLLFTPRKNLQSFTFLCNSSSDFEGTQ